MIMIYLALRRLYHFTHINPDLLVLTIPRMRDMTEFKAFPYFIHYTSTRLGIP